MKQIIIKILLATISLSLSLSSSVSQTATTKDCGILDSINYKSAYKLSEVDYLRAATCITKIDEEEIKERMDSLVLLTAKLAYYNQIGLLEDVTARLRPHATSKKNLYKLIRTEADLFRKQQKWHEADSIYAISADYATTEFEKAGSLVFSGYCAIVNHDDERGRQQYEKGMHTLSNPSLLSDEDYYFIYNLSAAINSMLGSQELAIKSYLKLFSNENLSLQLRARAASNMLDIFSGNEKCDSVRMFAHFARLYLDKTTSRTQTYWQLIKCDGVEGMIDSAEIHFKQIADFKTGNDQFLKPFVLSDYYAATNQGERILPIIEEYSKENPKDIMNAQYLRNNYIRSLMNDKNSSADTQIESYLSIKDSVSSEKLKNKIAETQIALDYKMSEAQSKSLGQELEFSNQSSKLRAIIAGSLGVGLILSCFLLYKVAGQRKKLNQSNEEISTLNRELNHRTANQISLAYELILDQRRQIGDEQAKASLERSESQLMALREVNRALAHRSDDLVRADEVLTKVAEGLQAASPYSFTLDLQLKAISVHGNAASRSALILSELLSNSIKYAFPNTNAPQATITISQNDQGTEITYLDNGPGADGTVQGTGVGSGLIEAMLEDLDAEFEEIQDEDGKGYGMRWWWG